MRGERPFNGFHAVVDGDVADAFPVAVVEERESLVGQARVVDVGEVDADEGEWPPVDLGDLLQRSGDPDGLRRGEVVEFVYDEEDAAVASVSSRLRRWVGRLDVFSRVPPPSIRITRRRAMASSAVSGEVVLPEAVGEVGRREDVDAVIRTTSAGFEADHDPADGGVFFGQDAESL